MSDLTNSRPGFQLSRGPPTNSPVLATLHPRHPPSRYEASHHLSPAASCKALRVSVYKLQRSSTCSTVSSPRRTTARRTDAACVCPTRPCPSSRVVLHADIILVCMQTLGPLSLDQAQHSRQLAQPLGWGGFESTVVVDDCSCSLFCFGNTIVLLPNTKWFVGPRSGCSSRTKWMKAFLSASKTVPLSRAQFSAFGSSFVCSLRVFSAALGPVTQAL